MQNQAIEKKNLKKYNKKSLHICKTQALFFILELGRGHLIPYYHGRVTSALMIYIYIYIEMYKFSKKKSNKNCEGKIENPQQYSICKNSKIQKNFIIEHTCVEATKVLGLSTNNVKK